MPTAPPTYAAQLVGQGANSGRFAAYTPNETHWISRSKYAQTGVQRRAVIECHGYGLQASDYFTYNGIVRPTARAGFPTIVPDCGGTGKRVDSTHGSGWSNNAAVNGISGATDWGRAEPDIRSDTVHLYGESMGTLASVVALARYPTKFRSYVSVLPALNLPDLHDNRNAPDGVTPLGPDIEAAYGGAAGYAAAIAAGLNNPMQLAAAIQAWGGPMLLCYSTSDPIALPLFVQQFAAAVGSQVTLYPIPGASGHDSSQLDPVIVTSFFAAYD